MGKYQEDDCNEMAFTRALRPLKAAFNEALQVQCADCLQWIDRDAKHTCKQQIRRNKCHDQPKGETK